VHGRSLMGAGHVSKGSSMYNPKIFRQEDSNTLRRWITENPFGVLVTAAGGELIATHLPFAITDVDDAGNWKLVGHMAAANRQSRTFDDQSEVLVIFSGPHSYVSPMLYAQGEQEVPTWHYSGDGDERRREEPALPTWNYVAVHVYGVPRVLQNKREVLSMQVRAHDGRWRLAGLPEQFLESREARIVAFEIPVRRIEGKAKLGQRQAADERGKVADALSRSTDSSVCELARMMKDLG